MIEQTLDLDPSVTLYPAYEVAPIVPANRHSLPTLFADIP